VQWNLEAKGVTKKFLKKRSLEKKLLSLEGKPDLDVAEVPRGHEKKVLKNRPRKYRLWTNSKILTKACVERSEEEEVDLESSLEVSWEV
jgi:hypothetical protein